MEPEPLALPGTDDAWGDWVASRAHEGLAEGAARVKALKAAEPGTLEILERWNDAQIALGNVAALSSLVGAVHPDIDVVHIAEGFQTETRRFGTDLRRDAKVFAALSSLEGAEGLDQDQRRVLDHALRGFRRAGVDQSKAVRGQLRLLDARMSELSQSFGRRIRDGRLTTSVPVAALDGLPEDYVEEHPSDPDGMVALSTDYPDTIPFLTYARDPAARRAVAATFANRGWPENDAVLAELLEVRAETARLLGYADWPSYDAEFKMIGKGRAIPEFVEQIAAAADEAGRSEIGVLLEAARAAGEDVVDASNWRHLHETVKRERFGVDAQQVRRFFDFAKVRQGLLDVTSRLFALSYEPVAAPTWHSDVASYDVVLTESGRRLGRIHLDLHPRARKFSHAAQFTLVSGIEGRQLAEGVLVCNFPRGLMDHREVVTLFHEFGHLMHHVLAGRHRWVQFSGVSTEWDFVEAPSQMLEEWAWNPEVLRGFATDASESPIPTDLVARMRAADEFGKGFLARTQTAYASISYWLHVERPADLTGRVAELMERYNLIAQLPGTHFHAGFGHLDGYGSAYYTYLWSLVIAKDMYSAFKPVDPFATDVAHRWRDTVLAPGGSADAADLVSDFLGRPYDHRAFTAWLERRTGTGSEVS
ncbi:MAG: M3 family metallopeptidase [Marmoricola sp.]